MYLRTKLWTGAGASSLLVLLVPIATGCSGVPTGPMFQVMPSQSDGDAPGGQAQGGSAESIDAGGAITPDAAPPIVSPVTPVAEAGAIDAGGADATEDAAPPDATPVSCSVTFLVTGAVIDGLTTQGVYLGGDTTALGDWNAANAVPLTQISSGVWTASLVMNDGTLVQFRFLERGPVITTWESWGANSNRSLLVSCLAGSSDATTPDASGSPVIGTAYTGEWDVKPPDAT
ncbi:MAG: CBM20 domain-containing protein [Polyangiaceae bacterium]